MDTGFDGHLAVPQAHADGFGAPDGAFDLELANGAVVDAQVYWGSVEVMGVGRPADAWIVALGNEYILGRAVIDRFRLTFDRGARLTAEA